MGILLKDVSLDDRYERSSGRAFITGTQALLLMLLQRKRLDEKRGHNTAGFLSGYRGSPLSNLDSEAWRAQKVLEANAIKFVPAVNEELAATAIWGTQQIVLDPKATKEGVFGMWYGKGAGLDRCGDVMRHAHGAGTSRHGGVLVVCGDDHQLKSSSQAYHCEPTFVDLLMPVLYPADIQEMIDFGLYGWEMSRLSGCWVGFKVLPETVNSTASVDLDISQFQVVFPEETAAATDRHMRWPDPWPQVERRLHEVKLPAALAFAKANRLDRTIKRAVHPDIGIIAPGKSYLDVCEALQTLGLNIEQAADRGLSLYKVGMPWPLESSGVEEFARGHRLLIVVEEKRDLIESQIKKLLYAWPDTRRPQIIGRCDEEGRPLFPSTQEVDPDMIAGVIAKRLGERLDERLGERIDPSATRELLARLALKQRQMEPNILVRKPYFCSGCPHNTSTRIPEGSRALAGVGCHYMAVDMARETATFTQMGGEGATWIGTAPFTRTEHIFVNLGEGTYFHSGLLAIRACVAAGVTITYKILFNDAVAMTGGQPVDGELSVPQITRQLRAEGVQHIEVIADDPHKYGAGAEFAENVRIRPRSALDAVQRELRKQSGVSVLVYDQVCATEKRRRRKRGFMPDTGRRVFINERVCEGCGDCGVQSNCLAIVPVETEFGRKRMIDQSQCNQDFSCLNGFCPSFVTLEGARPVAPKSLPSLDFESLPEPCLPQIAEGRPYNILLAGIGGTGVVTVGAILAMAAHLEGKAFSVHDRLGMAQKYGAVSSHIRLAQKTEDLYAARIPLAEADLVIGADLVASADSGTLKCVDPRRTKLVVSADQAILSDFTRDPDLDFKTAQLKARINNSTQGPVNFLESIGLAKAFLGDAIGANMLMLGFAWQKGGIPLSSESVERAIEINATSVALNKRAFALGRKAAHDPDTLKGALCRTEDRRDGPQDWQSLLERRAEFLMQYQNAAYADRYRAFVDECAAAEKRAMGEAGPLTSAVAHHLAKLMAYKDEYEVARLYSDGRFIADLRRSFAGGRLRFHLAPPLLARRDPVTGHLRKASFGSWMLIVFGVLAKLRGFRGSKFDIFGYRQERKSERALIKEYETTIRSILPHLDKDKLPICVEIASLPEKIRGYGHVKEAAISNAQKKWAQWLFAVKEGRSVPPLAAE